MIKALWQGTICLALLGLSACSNSHVTANDFQLIEKGMTRDKVITLLGTPDTIRPVEVGKITGANAQWIGEHSVIMVVFADQKVRYKSFGYAFSGVDAATRYP